MKPPTTNSNPLLLRGAAAIKEAGDQRALYNGRSMMAVDAVSGLPRHLARGGSEPCGTLITDVQRETTDDE